MSALGLRRPRSIWERYGIDTPATAETDLSDNRAPFRWFRMNCPSSWIFMTPAGYQRFITVANSLDNEGKLPPGGNFRGSGGGQLEDRRQLPDRPAPAEHRRPGERLEPSDLSVVEDLEQPEGTDQRRPGCPMRSVTDLHCHAEAAIQHGRAHETFGPTLGEHVGSRLHDRRIRTIPTRHHVGLGLHGLSDPPRLRLE